jgi:hypothetical protein
MLTADSKSYLHIVTDKPIEGKNFQEVHAYWHSLQDVTLTDRFLVGAREYRGSWSQDGGDSAAPKETRERRALGITGQTSFTFTGTSLAIRVSVNPGWGVGSVLVDGVPPSTIQGVTEASDIVTCNSDFYSSWGNEFIDVVLADNLPAGQHTVTISCTGNAQTAFFVFSGFKVYDFNKNTLDIDVWGVATAERDQLIGLTVKSRSISFPNTELSVDAKLVDALTFNPIGTLSLGSLGVTTPRSVLLRPYLTGNELAGTSTSSLVVSTMVPDPIGPETIVVTSDMPQNASAITYNGNWWMDSATETMPSIRGGQTRGAWFSFLSAGDTVGFECLTDWGLGKAQILAGVTEYPTVALTLNSKVITQPNTVGVEVGMTAASRGLPNGCTVVSKTGTQITLSAGATVTGSRPVAFGTYRGTIDLHETEDYKQGKLQAKSVSGFGPLYSGKTLVSLLDTKGFFYTAVKLTTNKTYSRITDRVNLNLHIKSATPFSVQDTRVEHGRVLYTTPDKNMQNLTAEVPHDNRGEKIEVSVEYRFPTFICCYASGYLELFKQYDVVITDPMALSRAQVKELQALGIKVINYVSFGEEDGVLTNIWDSLSVQGPYPGDGTGPGGSAGYYMKGGYENGEFSECTHDRQRPDGVKACANSNSHYLTSTGRCSKACSKDTRTGYKAWEDGGACGGGYTSANKWNRDASVACSNSTCPSYTPIHGGCPQYQQAESVWGQDFSIATQNFPDENGIWSSYYIDGVKRGPGSWFNRLKDYYLPLVFDEPKPIVETLTVGQYTQNDGTRVFGILLTNAPIDETEFMEIRDVATGITYTSGLDYSFDAKTGALILSVPSVVEVGQPPSPTIGQAILASYSKRGLGSDGVFMDTVDTVDVYPAGIYQQGFADIINDLKLLYPDRAFCSNRGFSIYDKMIHSCTWVMTESVFSDYNFSTGTYQLVSPEAEAWNMEVAAHMQELRKRHTFDVVCLNYAPNGPEGDVIREQVQSKTLDMGWLPWLSTILLNDPLPNRQFQRQKGFIRTNRWEKINVRNL